MTEISVRGVDPSALETRLPLDLAAMRALADQVLAGRVLDVYANILRDRETLRGWLENLADEVRDRIDLVTDRGFALTQIAEARFLMTLGPGDGLQSATDRTRGLASMVKTLAGLYEAAAQTSQPPT